MTGPVIIRLSGDPVGKGRPRFVRASGRAFTPAKTRSYEAALRYAAQEVMGERAPMEGPLRVLVVAAFPIPKSYSKGKRLDALSGSAHPTKRPDWENIAKTLDALNGVVWVDDVQIIDGRVLKTYASRPELTIEVRAA
jgi:Holliday junction resolvase RusA-like endonuclease